MKRFIFLFYLIAILCIYSYSDALEVNFEFNTKQHKEFEYELYTSWWPQENEKMIFVNGVYKRTLFLPENMKLQIIVFKDSKIWFDKSFVVKDNLKIKKDLDKMQVNLIFDNSLCPELKQANIMINNKKYSEIDLSKKNKETIFLDYDQDHNIFLIAHNYKYGPIFISKQNNLSKSFYNIKLSKNENIDNVTKPREVTVNFYGNIKGITFKVFENNKEKSHIKNVNETNSIYVEQPLSSKIVIYNEHNNEIFNSGLDIEYLNINVFDVSNIKILGNKKDLSYRVDGIRDNININKKIPGPLCYIEKPEIEIFSGEKKIHNQNFNQILKNYSFINLGYSKVIIRFRWSGEEKKYIQRNWNDMGNIVYPEEFDEIKIKNDSIYEKIYYLKPVNIDSKKEYQFQICDVTGKKSSLYPLKIFSYDDILWTEDLDNYKNRSLLNIEFVLRILPVNKWDSFYLKHNFQGYPDGFTGLTKERLINVDKEEMLFKIKRDVYEGEKRFELWGYDKETDTYDEIYSKDFYLDRSIKIFYDYDKPEKLIKEEKYYYLFVLLIFSVALLYWLISFIKKNGTDIALFFKEGHMDKIFDKQVNYIKYDEYFYNCFIKMKKHIKVYDYDEKCVEKIIKDSSFFNGNGEIIIRADLIDKKDMEKIKKVASEEILKIYVFCYKMNKGDFYVKISHEKAKNKIIILENEKKNIIKVVCDEHNDISII